MPKRILVVEDDNDLNMLLRLMMKIKQEDWELSSATTGSDAMEQVKQLNPDLVLLDIMLPGISGLEVLRRLRADPRRSDLKIVMLTALSDAGTREQAMTLGATDYWTKPFTPTELLERLQSVLE
jgi:DNA-binding response OmpR family regulator